MNDLHVFSDDTSFIEIVSNLAENSSCYKGTCKCKDKREMFKLRRFVAICKILVSTKDWDFLTPADACLFARKLIATISVAAESQFFHDILEYSSKEKSEGDYLRVANSTKKVFDSFVSVNNTFVSGSSIDVSKERAADGNWYIQVMLHTS